MSDENDNIDSDLMEHDVKFVRNNYIRLIELGNDAIEEMIVVAKSTEHPRAFEVLSHMFKHVGDLNSGLLDIHKKKKDVITKEINNESTTNNNLFLGSTTDLQRLLHSKDFKESVEATIDITPEEEDYAEK